MVNERPTSPSTTGPAQVPGCCCPACIFSISIGETEVPRWAVGVSLLDRDTVPSSSCASIISADGRPPRAWGACVCDTCLRAAGGGVARGAGESSPILSCTDIVR
jgi:hypothetical protein